MSMAAGRQLRSATAARRATMQAASPSTTARISSSFKQTKTSSRGAAAAAKAVEPEASKPKYTSEKRVHTSPSDDTSEQAEQSVEEGKPSRAANNGGESGESGASTSEPPPKRQKKSFQGKPPSPFPNHSHPTPSEVKTVVDLLSTVHGVHTRPPQPPLPNLLVTGCGEVPSILDALIRTLLSASTTAANSNRAFKGLVEKFGVCGKKGSVDWEKVRRASEKEVFEAIKSGGLANVKSKRIKSLLQRVWEEAQVRKEERRKKMELERQQKAEGAPEEEKQTPGEDEEGDEDVMISARDSTGKKQVIKQHYHGHQLIHTTSLSNSADTEYFSDDDLSLDHLHLLPDDEAMAKLTSYDGIGFKTASCVMLFCMSRESFAVDTHVFRLVRFLNWVPPDKATRETAFWHLDERVPGEYKYALHQLFIKHGRTCGWCRAGGPLKWEDGVKMEDVEEKEVEEDQQEEEEGKWKGRKVKPKVSGRERKKSAEVKVKSEISEDGEDTKMKAISSSTNPTKKSKYNMEKCPIEHLVKRFHGTTKGKGGLKWEEADNEIEMADVDQEKSRG